ncbi:transposase [uncultured Prevotella sp.]|uniref:transposase n=1 Tax=uncultured Prevotella sp. TaxID=159272 RepID=UPI00261B1AE4|nr:transposase [uncultured Prevotella sp.]
MSSNSDTNIPHDIVQFLEKKKNVAIWGSKLPHWFQEQKTMFITFRLADSLPSEAIDNLRLDQLFNKSDNVVSDYRNKEHYRQALMRKIEKYLNNGHGKCILQRDNIRNIVIEALHYYDGTEYVLHAFVIMPNHVHLLLSPLGKLPVNTIIGQVKSYSGHKIKKLLNCKDNIWQSNMFDRIVRNGDDFEKIIKYIEENPKGLNKEQYTLYIRENI